MSTCDVCVDINNANGKNIFEKPPQYFYCLYVVASSGVEADGSTQHTDQAAEDPDSG